jgi:protocatechuate 3,4-dioxygenase alpha subunit
MSGAPATPSQTVGPFFELGMSGLTATDITGGATGRAITVRGTVFDGHGQPVPDAVLETWQADPAGTYVRLPSRAGAFRGFARLATDEAGRFQLRTLMPGRVDGPNGVHQAPHVLVAIFMRGLLKHLVTRIYFAGEQANETDPVLKLVEPARRETLIAARDAEHGDVFIWHVRLQGPGETVFLDV